jgi:CRP-like cAMP-binding protein
MPPDGVMALLRSNPIFAGVPAREIDALAPLVRVETLRAREYAFMEGDAAQWFYVVKSGHVKIMRQSRTGKDVILELLGRSSAGLR